MRVVFCLFTDNTGIFERDGFLNLLEQRSSVDGADTGMRLHRLFDVLNTPEQDRSALPDEDLARFPYINAICSPNSCNRRISTHRCTRR